MDELNVHCIATSNISIFFLNKIIVCHLKCKYAGRIKLNFE